jgi:UDP-N-acetylglucosamine 3-dehydrogenase
VSGLRTGIVGLGEIGSHHLAAIRSSPDATLTAVCDLDGELARSSAAGEVPAHTDLDEMLDSTELDALAVCLPHSLHVDAALAAIERGCHVLLEKPFAVDLDGCDRIAAAAAAAGVEVGVSHNQLAYLPHRRLGELIAAGSLGELRALYARLWIGERYRGWREDPAIAGGGLLMDAGVHRIYLLQALGGEVTAVTATMDSPRAEERFEVALELAGGAVALAQGSYFGPAGTFDDRVDVVGTAGAAAVAGCEAYFEGDLGDEPQLRVRLGGEWSAADVTDSWDASVARSVHEALAAFAAGRPAPVGPTAARATVAVIEAAYRAAETGERIELGATGAAATEAIGERR